MNGPICIVMDGLMMYLGRDAQADTLQNIKAILKKHGGAYITTDFSAREIVMASSKVVYGDTEDARAVFHASAKVYEDIADARFEQNFFSSSDEAKKFIEAQGLKVELLPLFDAPTKLYSAKNFNKEQMKRLDALEKDAFLWVITVK